MENNLNNKVGINIAKCRRLNGISQKYLAEMVGISSQGLHKIEKGKVSPRVSTLERICAVLCVTPNQLFGVEQITEENGSLIERIRRIQA